MKRQVALDTETTGRANDGTTTGDHRIIEIGCVEIVDRKLTGRELQIYLDPERPVDPEATRVHGMTWDMLKGKPRFRDIAPVFIDFIRGAELLIHNAKFDTAFMDREFALMGLHERTTDISMVTDTVALALKLLPGHQVNLDNLCNLMGVSNKHRTKHGALLDAQLLAEVYLAMTGGPRAFDLTVENALSEGPAWQRPQGLKLPVMGVETARHAMHVHTMLGLAQGVKFKTEGETAMAGSAWGPEYDMPYLAKGKEEDKKAYKARLQAQHDEMLGQLLSASEQEALEQALAADAAAYKEWEDRVLGRAPK